MPGLMTVLAHTSARPRYAFMVLNLIAEVAGPDGSAGPLVANGGDHMPLRDWLCDALAPMGHRDPRRIALTDRVRTDLAQAGLLPKSAEESDRLVDEEVRNRVRTASKSNLSRAVSELVRAGLLHRHYQGFRVDHRNRGAQRQAVYTLSPATRGLLGRTGAVPAPLPASPELPL